MSRQYDKGSTEGDYSSKMHDYLVTLERLPSTELTEYNRREKYRILQDYITKLRAKLTDWIDEHGISDEIAEVGKATAFNLLFVRCTENAAAILRNAPGIIDIVLTEDIPIELY